MCPIAQHSKPAFSLQSWIQAQRLQKTSILAPSVIQRHDIASYLFKMRACVAQLKSVPLQVVCDPVLERAGLSLSVMRLDLIDAVGSGNKFFKLYQHLENIRVLKPAYVLSFGGAYSNHLHALAHACKEFDIQSIALVRAAAHAALTPTLRDVQRCGMQLRYLSYSDYRQRNSAAFIAQLKQQYPGAYLIAEGAADALGLEGAMLMGFYVLLQLQRAQKNCDLLALACGTASSWCGILAALSLSMYDIAQRSAASMDFQPVLPKLVLGVPILKVENMRSQLQCSLAQLAQQLPTELLSLPNGQLDEQSSATYAQCDAPLHQFAQRMLEQELPLDPIYTAKLLQRLLSMAEQGAIAAGSQIVALHTGGLQGCRGIDGWLPAMNIYK